MSDFLWKCAKMSTRGKLKQDNKIAKGDTASQDGDQNRIRSKSVGDAGEEWDCKECKTSFRSDQDKLMVCDLCLLNFCTPCINMSSTEYSALQSLKRTDVFWLCQTCVGTVRDTRAHKSVSKDLGKLKSDLSKKFVQLEEKVDSLTKKLSEAPPPPPQHNFTKTFAEIMVGNKNKSDASLQNKVEEIGMQGMMENLLVKQRQEITRNQCEKDERDKNVIIYKKGEVEGLTMEDRKKQDTEFVQKLLGEIERQDIEVKNIFRLGQFHSDKNNEGKCRPIKLSFYNRSDRDSVMRNLFKLKETTDNDIKKIQVGYDLTKEEQDRVKSKIEEAKALSTDEVFWRVRGPPWALRMIDTKRRV